MIFLSLWHNWNLIWQMTKREVIGRYRGSVMGLFWSFFNPLLMLVVYIFVFGVVFKARWNTGASTGQAEFAIILFSGLITFHLFSESINRAPGLVLSNVNFVKKVVFPLEILPWVAVGCSLFHALINVFVLLIFFAFTYHFIYWTALLLPLVWLPFVLLIMGISWFLAATGVYIRDVGQVVGVVTSVLMFLSPIFYPIDALSENYRFLLHLNPLTFVLEQVRAIIVWGQLPNWTGLMLYLLASIMVAALGFAWFQKTRKGFADVI
jgi:lipopolysaccharide transport system permease protein